jgi:hypothetical protein
MQTTWEISMVLGRARAACARLSNRHLYISTKNFGLVQHVSPTGGSKAYIMRIKQQHYTVT